LLVWMSYDVRLLPGVWGELNSLDEKSKRIIMKNLKKLKENPYPGKGIGDKELVPVRGKLWFRMHIGRRWTVFYLVAEDLQEVRVIEILPIGKAHKAYGFD